jgi:hypothetical protein
VLLAYVPRLPSSSAPAGFGLASGSLRITPGTSRRLRAFATTQIAFSFVLLAGAGMLVATLIALQTANTGFDTRQVLALDVPPVSLGSSTPNPPTPRPSRPGSNPAPVARPGTPQGFDGDGEVTRRVGQLPGVDGVAAGNFVPWRDVGNWPRFQFTVEGYKPADGEDNPYARMRFVGPGFFALLGIQVLAGREFTDADRRGGERVVIVSQTIAQRLFPNGDALNRMLWSTGQRANPVPSRIVGVVADVDDENVLRAPAMTVYSPHRQAGIATRLFVRTSGDPYTLVPAVTRIIRELSPNQAVERPATLEDVRAEVLTPERLNAFVVSGFAGIALLIAVVGVSGVLAFSVSARTREFGIRLAVGSSPRRLLMRVLSEGASIVAIGIAAGAAAAYGFAGVASSYLEHVRLPGALPVLAAATILGAAAIAASLMPAARASRVDVLQVLRSE